MSANVRAAEEDHTQSRILILHLFKESLPDADFCPRDEELGCSPPGAEFRRYGPLLRSVLMAPENRR